MSMFWRALVVALLALPVGAYVAGGLTGSQADLPDQRPPVQVADPRQQPEPSTTMTGGPSDPGDGRDDDNRGDDRGDDRDDDRGSGSDDGGERGDDGDDDEVRIVRPELQDLDDDDGDDDDTGDGDTDDGDTDDDADDD
jgi:hypothetical protein